MSLFILDASVALSWLLDDEDDAIASRALDRLEQGDALVPSLWHLEVRNALLAAARRGRLDADQLAVRMAELNRLPIQTDAEVDLSSAWILAQAHRLSFYDAVYLELAVRREAPLATLGKALARAAAAESLTIHDGG